MGKSKYENIPLEIIDPQNRMANQRHFSSSPPEKALLKTKDRNAYGMIPTESKSPSLEEIFEQLFLLAKHFYFELAQQFKEWDNGRIASLKIPWLQIGLLALAIFILLKKDMQFNIALKAPVGAAVEDEQNSGLVQQSLNPYAPLAANMLEDKQALDFIKKYSVLAIQEMKASGIPASIKMAQALIESRAGTSNLALRNNNHFGMKCFSRNCRKGHCTNAFDDHHKDFFRKYEDTEKSWQSHSRLLTQGRYKHLAQFGLDYKKWANGLKQAGYATDKLYAKKLINTIEKYQLYRLDK